MDFYELETFYRFIYFFKKLAASMIVLNYLQH